MSYIGKAPGFGIRNRYYYTATASQTTFSGADDNGQTLAYADSKYLDVYLNGVLLVAGTDYTATTLTSVTLASGASASDIVEIVAYDIFSVADTVSAANGGTFNGNITIDGDLSVDGGTIKLDGNYPTGTDNVALGDTALDSLTSGASNVAIGANALTANTSGSANVAIGKTALQANTGSGNNVAVGGNALYNSTAANLTAVGNEAGFTNSTGTRNAYFGHQAGYNSTSTDLLFCGYQAGKAVTTGLNSAFVGTLAGQASTTGNSNTYVGTEAGFSATTPSDNTFVGRYAGGTITTGGKNTILGRYNGNQDGLDIRTSDNNIVLSDGDGDPRGYFLNGSSQWFFPSVYSETTGSAVNVNVGSSGNLRRSTSSLRYKNTVQDMSYGLSDVMNLRPVTYKGNNDGDTVFGGLIAEEVHDAGLTEFVQYDDEGRPDALAYGNMVALAFKAIQELKAENDSLKSRIEALENA